MTVLATILSMRQGHNPRPLISLSGITRDNFLSSLDGDVQSTVKSCRRCNMHFDT